MTSILVVGAGRDVTRALQAHGLGVVTSVDQLRALVEAMPQLPSAPMILGERIPPPAPQFGGDRPYLKRKKGRS